MDMCIHPVRLHDQTNCCRYTLWQTSFEHKHNLFENETNHLSEMTRAIRQRMQTFSREPTNEFSGMFFPKRCMVKNGKTILSRCYLTLTLNAYPKQFCLHNHHNKCAIRCCFPTPKEGKNYIKYLDIPSMTPWSWHSIILLLMLKTS